MTAVVIRPLVAGEESLFESMPDPLPQVRKTAYADGIAMGGFQPERTWVALRDGRVVARAAWVLPPGAVGQPWLERFDLDAEPDVGAALLDAAHEAFGGPLVYYAALPAYWRRQPEVNDLAGRLMAAARLAGLVEGPERYRCSWTGGPLPERSGRHTIRPATGVAEIRDLVAAVTGPEVLTGAETALAVGGVDLAVDPLAWTGETPGSWWVALRDGEPVGLAGTAGDACFPQLVYLGFPGGDAASRADLLTGAVAALVEGGAREVVADVDAHRVAVIAELERAGFRRLRSRIAFAPA